MDERTVTVLVATELLAQLGEWSEPLQARISSIDDAGMATMEFRRPANNAGWRWGLADKLGGEA